MEKLIGRENELRQLQRCYESSRSEFVIVYGRRRIGKTFLVRQFCRDRYSFSYTGSHHYSQKEQLANFAESLREYGRLGVAPRLGSWFEAFQALRGILDGLPRVRRKLVFFDEMPWIDHARSDFVRALENFWNGWGGVRDDIMFIACGSATSWMVDKLICNIGGLHNRVTCSIYLRPFTLRETEAYLQAHSCHWDRYQILQCMMTLGGVPYYLSLLDFGRSLVQNIDALFFAKNGLLRNEFGELYTASFSQSDKYLAVVGELFRHGAGMTKSQLLAATKLDGKLLKKILENLERCDFAVSAGQYGNKLKDSVYRLVDFYTLFYLQFVADDHGKDEHFWSHTVNTPGVDSWQGLAFERVCLSHLDAIKESLGISGILTCASGWRSPQAQIDLVIDRADRMVNLCEMKFSTAPYVITKEYAEHLRQRQALFQEAMKTRKGIVSTFVTTYGVKPGAYGSLADVTLTLDDLFR